MTTIHTTIHTSNRTSARRNRRITTTTVLAVGGLLFGAASGVAAADSPPAELDIIIAPAEQTCPKSGKVDVAGNHTSLQILAPADTLIAGYCVKAGSANQGDGPEHYVVDPAATQITISHSSGKAISHYTLVLIDRPLTTPDPDQPSDNPGDLTTPDPHDEPGDNPGDLTTPDPDQPGDNPGDLTTPDPDQPGDEPQGEPGDEPQDSPGDEPAVEPVIPGDEPEVEPVIPGDEPEVEVFANPPSEVPTSGAPTPGSDIQTLPSTGVNSGVLALLASLLVATGGVLTRTTRRIGA